MVDDAEIRRQLSREKVSLNSFIIKSDIFPVPVIAGTTKTFDAQGRNPTCISKETYLKTSPRHSIV